MSPDQIDIDPLTGAPIVKNSSTDFNVDNKVGPRSAEQFEQPTNKEPPNIAGQPNPNATEQGSAFQRLPTQTTSELGQPPQPSSELPQPTPAGVANTSTTAPTAALSLTQVNPDHQDRIKDALRDGGMDSMSQHKSFLRIMEIIGQILLQLSQR